jgi:hypothetical protein
MPNEAQRSDEDIVAQADKMKQSSETRIAGLRKNCDAQVKAIANKCRTEVSQKTSAHEQVKDDEAAIRNAEERIRQYRSQCQTLSEGLEAAIKDEKETTQAAIAQLYDDNAEKEAREFKKELMAKKQNFLSRFASSGGSGGGSSSASSSSSSDRDSSPGKRNRAGS